MIEFLSNQIKKLGIEIILGKEATRELVEEFKPDLLFIATGSSQIIPDIPGIESDRVVTATEVLLGKCDPGDSVVVIGGGLVGCEVALYLSQKNKKLTVLEILDSAMSDMYSINRAHMEKLLGESNVNILTDTTVLEITNGSVNIVDKSGLRSTLEADTVVIAVGFEPNNKLVATLKDKVSEMYAIGDCVKPRRVINAVWEGFRLARIS